MSTYADSFCSALVSETKRRLFEESIPRLRQCLGRLTPSEIWTRPNEHSNSVGNLVLHLCGNARQWVVSGLGGALDNRERDLEFSERAPLPTSRLLELLDELERDVNKVLDHLSPDDLLLKRKVQVFEESGLSILIHVVEHFSYHVGQVTYFVKLRKDIDTGYYADLNLDVDGG